MEGLGVGYRKNSPRCVCVCVSALTVPCPVARELGLGQDLLDRHDVARNDGIEFTEGGLFIAVQTQHKDKKQLHHGCVKYCTFTIYLHAQTCTLYVTYS